MAAGDGATCGALQPGDELLNGELLGQAAIVAAGGWSGVGGCGWGCLDNGGSGSRDGRGSGRGGGSSNGRRRGGDSGRGSGSRTRSCAASSATRTGVGTSHECRARNIVRGDLLVGVEENTGVGRGVQLGAERTLGKLGARPIHVDVEALRVVLGAVLRAGAVEGDDLVAEHVRAGLQVGGDDSVPRGVVGDERDRRERLGSRVVPGLVDLDPLEGRLVDVGAGPRVLGHVGQHGSHVGLGPVLVPVEADSTAGRGLGGDGTRRGGLVADDVRLAVGVRLNEAVVRVFGVPPGIVGEGTGVYLLIVV